MLKPDELLHKASSSKFYLWILNRVLSRMIAFNSPHKLRIEEITAETLVIGLPYLRRNTNHLRGLHACALATLSEYVCGLTLARTFKANQYRLIMKELQMTYHYQGKQNCRAAFTLPKGEIEEVNELLKTETSVFRTYEVNTYDNTNNHLCTAKVTWQLKEWKATAAFRK